jgi:acetyl esterase/lipase
MADISDVPDTVINNNYLKLNVFFGEGDGPHPCVIHMHGGSFNSGSYTELSVNEVSGLTSEGYTVISVQYRKVGQEATWGGEAAVQCPSQIDDVRNHIQVIRSWATVLNIDPERIGLWGFSVGGQLAALASRNGEYNDTSGDSSVQACVSVAPPTQFFSALTYSLPRVCSVGDGVAYDATFTVYNRWPSQWIGYDQVGEGLSALSSTQASPYFENTLSSNPGAYVLSSSPPLNVIHGDEDCVIPSGHGDYLHNAWTAAGASSTMTLVSGMAHTYNTLATLTPTWNFFINNL